MSVVFQSRQEGSIVDSGRASTCASRQRNKGSHLSSFSLLRPRREINQTVFQEIKNRCQNRKKKKRSATTKRSLNVFNTPGLTDDTRRHRFPFPSSRATQIPGNPNEKWFPGQQQQPKKKNSRRFWVVVVVVVVPVVFLSFLPPHFYLITKTFEPSIRQWSAFQSTTSTTDIPRLLSSTRWSPGKNIIAGNIFFFFLNKIPGCLERHRFFIFYFRPLGFLFSFFLHVDCCSKQQPCA